MDKTYDFLEGNIRGDFYSQEDDELKHTDNKTTEFDSE